MDGENDLLAVDSLQRAIVVILFRLFPGEGGVDGQTVEQQGVDDGTVGPVCERVPG